MFKISNIDSTEKKEGQGSLKTKSVLEASGKSVSEDICNQTSGGMEHKVLVLFYECCVAIPFR